MSLNVINFLAEEATTVASADAAKFWAVAIIGIALALVGVMEALAVVFTLNGTARNPEAASKLRTTMLIGVALVETIAIYLLIVAMLLLFVA